MSICVKTVDDAIQNKIGSLPNFWLLSLDSMEDLGSHYVMWITFSKTATFTSYKYSLNSIPSTAFKKFNIIQLKYSHSIFLIQNLRDFSQNMAFSCL